LPANVRFYAFSVKKFCADSIKAIFTEDKIIKKTAMYGSRAILWQIHITKCTLLQVEEGVVTVLWHRAQIAMS